MPARLIEIHGARDVMGRIAPGTQVSIDVAGAPNIVPDVVRMARSCARLVVIAAYTKSVELDLGAMLLSEMSICTSMGYPDELETVVELMPSLTDKLDLMIIHRFVMEAFGVAGAAETGKVMVEF